MTYQRNSENYFFQNLENLKIQIMDREPNKVRFSNIAKNIAITQINILIIAHYVRNITSTKLFVKLATKSATVAILRFILQKVTFFIKNEISKN